MRWHREEERSHIEKTPIILSPGANEVLRKTGEIPPKCAIDRGANQITRKKRPLGKPLIAGGLKVTKDAM
jgi:hypothetical protein